MFWLPNPLLAVGAERVKYCNSRKKDKTHSDSKVMPIYIIFPVSPIDQKHIPNKKCRNISQHLNYTLKTQPQALLLYLFLVQREPDEILLQNPVVDIVLGMQGHYCETHGFLYENAALFELVICPTAR